jgi:hypothetical protein
MCSLTVECVFLALHYHGEVGLRKGAKEFRALLGKEHGGKNAVDCGDYEHLVEHVLQSENTFYVDCGDYEHLVEHVLQSENTFYVDCGDYEHLVERDR